MLLKKTKPKNYLKSWIEPWEQLDWLLLILFIGLMVFGGLMIRSAELNQGVTDWWQHWIIGGIGLILTFLISRISYDHLLQWHWVIYGITNIFLIAVMILGTAAKGAQRWLTIGGFNLQPSEFAKVAIIITLAALLQDRPASNIGGTWRAILVAAIPGMWVFMEPNLGTTLIFGAITMGMIYWANANPAWLILLGSPLIASILYYFSYPWWIVWSGIITLICFLGIRPKVIGLILGILFNFAGGYLGNVFWEILKPYQKDRIISFLDPSKDPLRGGYHLIQSRIAIGSGELWGKGLHHGTQTQLNFIPEQHTDFIFSAIGEELGFIGCMVVIAIFWLICLRLVLLAQSAKDNFGSLMAIGLLSMIVFQVFVNVGMNIGLTPVTGIPLPLISYGRSALLSNFIALGIIQSIANHRPKSKFFFAKN